MRRLRLNLVGYLEWFILASTGLRYAPLRGMDILGSHQGTVLLLFFIPPYVQKPSACRFQPSAAVLYGSGIKIARKRTCNFTALIGGSTAWRGTLSGVCVL
jgi:hypothetical protein